MNDTIKKLSDDFKVNLTQVLASADWKAFAEKMNAASDEDSGTFEVVISTADADRSGEMIMQEGCDESNYLNNPIVLWAHDYASLPIGVCTSMEVRGGKRIAKGRFAPADANPFAQQVRKLYDAGIVRATSVGLIVRKMEGKKITQWELLEFSFVPVPANPFALSLSKAKELGLDVGMLTMKGLEVKEKAEGDVCTLDDGTEGMINAEGNCMPKPTEKATGDTCTLDDGSEGVIDENGVCVAKPATTEEAAKGAVADQITAEDMWEQKWQNLDKVCEIINAFMDVYLKEETPVADFPTLVTELSQLIAGLGATEPAVVESSIKELIGKASKHVSRNSKEAGELIEKIMAIHKGSEGKESTPTINKDVQTEGADIVSTAGEEHKDESAPEQRSKAPQETPTKKELDDFLMARQLVKAVATAAQDALTHLNKREREIVKRR